MCGSGGGSGELGVAAALGNTFGMGLGWADWIRFVLAPLVLGLIAAIVATRNAKKTPHERLKNLVDIHDKMPDHLDSIKVVEAAIARELVDFDRRVAADQKGFWAGARERFAQFGGTIEVSIGFVLFAMMLTVIVTHEDNDDTSPWAFVLIVAAVIVAGVGLIVRFSLFRAVRKSLRLDRAAAHISATFPRTGIQLLASQDVIPPQDIGAEFGEAAARLKTLGVYKSDGSSTGLRLTPFGKEAIQLSLRNADRQHFAHMADVKAEMEARESESGPDAAGQ